MFYVIDPHHTIPKGSAVTVPGPGYKVEVLSHVKAPSQLLDKFCYRTTTLSPRLSMESLNLNALAGSLPTSNLANAEKELLNTFKGKSVLFFLFREAISGD
jgi:hypothetical protein